MVASREKVTGLVCEILQTKNSLSQNEEGQDERNYEVKQVLEREKTTRSLAMAKMTPSKINRKRPRSRFVQIHSPFRATV